MRLPFRGKNRERNEQVQPPEGFEGTMPESTLQNLPSEFTFKVVNKDGSETPGWKLATWHTGRGWDDTIGLVILK